MMFKKTEISGIPAIVWGESSDKVYIHIHGKMSKKEYAEGFADIASKKGWQVISFDLPEHGERAGKSERCDVFTAVKELNAIADYAFSNWKKVALFACSLGAYFALNAYSERDITKCLFQSPIVDMPWLVDHMMLWNGIDISRLEREKEIYTPIDTLRWDYYSYIISHAIEKWPHDTRILYGGKDALQPIESIEAFCEKFGAHMTLEKGCEHPFMDEGDDIIVNRWLEANI